MRGSGYLCLALFAPLGAGAQIAVGVPYTIESDSKATYANVEFGGKGKLRTIVTHRNGPSGPSFTRREVDCDAGTFRYLGTGDSLEEMRKSKAGGKMSPLTDRSISSYVAAQACEPYLSGKRQAVIDSELRKSGIKR